MNNLILIGEVIQHPIEIFKTKKNNVLYKFVIRVKNNENDNQIIMIKAWDNLFKNNNLFDEGEIIAIVGKIQSFGSESFFEQNNDVYASSLTLIN